MTRSGFCIDEKPTAVAFPDPRAASVEYLRSVDTQYFEYVANACRVLLQDDDRSNQHRAAQLLRQNMFQAVEATISLTFAVLQAPDNIPGWLSRYKLHHLRSLSEKVKHGRPFPVRVFLANYQWSGISEAIMENARFGSLEIERQTIGTFVKFLAWSADLVASDAWSEYNAMKHGVRVFPGGFVLRMGIERIPGQAAATEALRTIMSSEFGTTYPIAREVDRPQKGLVIGRASVGWRPDEVARQLVLASQLIHNLVLFARLYLRDEVGTEVAFVRPTDLRTFTGSSSAEPQIRFFPNETDGQSSEEAIWSTYAWPLSWSPHSASVIPGTA
ncbi:MAG: hypothetical protein AB7T37_02825 [Dehalococcoidia bacterium]